MSLSSSSNSSKEGMGLMETPVDQEPMAEAAAAAANNSSNSSSNNNQNYDSSAHVIVKGKRTKRQRLHQSSSSLPIAAAHGPTATATSSTSSAEFSGTTTEEEEDMANCLILLAQGRALDTSRKKPEVKIEDKGSGGAGGGEKFTSRRFAEAATTTNGKAGFYVYECKTCNKCFPSFQALGGHRASHKKPKMASTTMIMAMDQEKKAMEEDNLQISIASFPNKPIMAFNTNTTISNSGSNKQRVHECSICGSEFSSGQALGGHMRRHRSMTMAAEPPQESQQKEKSLLSLDLNLPAPSEDDHGEVPKPSVSAGAFPSFTNKQPQLLFPASALVDCHY